MSTDYVPRKDGVSLIKQGFTYDQAHIFISAQMREDGAEAAGHIYEISRLNQVIWSAEGSLYAFMSVIVGDDELADWYLDLYQT